jgi:tetratricopeptide (TPR) repeat protein
VQLPPAIADAGRALASGDALRALGFVGRTESALGMTLRGIAYAQLGDLELARESLEQAVALRSDPLTRARAQAALVEVLLGMGEAAPAAKAARAASEELARLGDARNAAMQRLVLARAEVLLGRLNDARHRVDELVASDLPDDVRAVASLAQAEIAMRAVSASGAREALTRARKSLEQAPNALLARALVAVEQELTRPLARLVREGRVREADLFVIEDASRGEVLLVDACRRLAIGGRVTVPLARRPVLFALLLELARAWPASLSRDELATRAFDVRRVNDSHRARLRVELGRLRKLVVDCGAEPVASEDGYVLASKRDVALLLPPSDDDDARIALLLGDGAAWTARSVAEHAGVSKSTAQRALAALVERGAVVRTGKGKDIRYTRAGTPIASRMLLLGLVPKP